MVGRRDIIFGMAGGGLALGVVGMGRASAEILTCGPPTARFDALEVQSGGRLGVAALDLETGAVRAYKARQRFPMCSTFKFVLAGCILARVDQGRENLGRKIPVRTSDLVSHAPTVEKHVGGALTLEALCEAAVTQSDNAATNLILGQIGGPKGFTAFARGLGDPVTRLDRWETAMSESAPGDIRDTTSPQAMLENLQKLVLGTVLSPASRQQLTDWLVANQTGDATLRAGLPKAWRVGDKTGAGDHGTRNDVAIAWPPGRKPILISAYLTGSKLNAQGRDAVLAEVGRIVAAGV
jgi:beta-lactamase class A